MSIKDKVAEYVKKDGVKCIQCDDRDLESVSSPKVMEGAAHQRIRCNGCGSEWVDVYSLIGVVNLELTGVKL